MKIKVKGPLPTHIKSLGVKPGQIYEAEPAAGTRLDAVLIRIPGDEGEIQYCTLLPKNFDKQ